MTKEFVIGDFDANAIGKALAEHQRELFAIVQACKNLRSARADATAAAAELLRWYARFGEMDAPEVQDAIESGQKRVLLKVARMSLANASHKEVSPLDYFVAELDGPGGGPASVSARRRRLELRAAHGDLMTPAEAMKYLTTQSNNNGKATTLPLAKRAKTLGEAERWLIASVKEQHPGLTEEDYRNAVRQLFPNNSWDKPQTPVTWHF